MTVAAVAGEKALQAGKDILLQHRNLSRHEQSHPSGVRPDVCSSRASQDSISRPSPDRLLAAPRGGRVDRRRLGQRRRPRHLAATPQFCGTTSTLQIR